MVDLIVPHPDDERRWRNSQARGARRSIAKKMRGWLLLIVAAFLVWAFVQLA